ncbi:MAG: UDP-N-acetylmuramoyl-L-alanine--D-glutamate ligase [Patescibacteria group bacterium]
MMFKKVKEYFSGKKVLLIGLGLQGGGAGTARFLRKAGADLTITDLKSENDLAASIKKISESGIKFVLGRHRKEDFARADIIVKNPGVPQESPFIFYARNLGKPVWSDTQIFFNLIPREKIIGITGTKGKSTTCRLLQHFLKRRFDARLIGLPGSSALEDLMKRGNKLPDYFIYELSSFSLENLKTSPKYALVTNLFPDHLNRYSSFGEYLKAKENIFIHQQKGDVLWLNKRDPISLAEAKKAGKRSKIIFFIPGQKPILTGSIQAKLISPASLEASRKVAQFFGISPRDTNKMINSFSPEEGRLQYIGKINGIYVINDTTATNPGSALFGIRQVLKCFGLAKNRLILIAGGDDKNLDYHDFSRYVSGLKKIIFLPGTATDKIIDAAKEFSSSNYFPASGMPEAAAFAFEAAKKGDVILFSPAAASFNLFKNEFDRGRSFVNAVRTGKKRLL